jgi:hypothetical protein
MIRRHIDLDEESDSGRALSDLLQAHESVEFFAEECEEAQRDSLLARKNVASAFPRSKPSKINATVAEPRPSGSGFRTTVKHPRYGCAVSRCPTSTIMVDL